jgi:hypothetical protein
MISLISDKSSQSFLSMSWMGTNWRRHTTDLRLIRSERGAFILHLQKFSFTSLPICAQVNRQRLSITIIVLNFAVLSKLSENTLNITEFFRTPRHWNWERSCQFGPSGFVHRQVAKSVGGTPLDSLKKGTSRFDSCTGD